MLIYVVRKEVGMFIKILTKSYKGEKRYYASLVENKRINGKVVQFVKANLGLLPRIRSLILRLPMPPKSLVLFMTMIDAEVL